MIFDYPTTDFGSLIGSIRACSVLLFVSFFVVRFQIPGFQFCGICLQMFWQLSGINTHMLQLSTIEILNSLTCMISFDSFLFASPVFITNWSPCIWWCQDLWFICKLAWLIIFYSLYWDSSFQSFSWCFYIVSPYVSRGTDF